MNWLTMILFPGGDVRLSTVLVFAAFVALAVRRGDRVPVLAAVAWLAGFEAVFEAAALGFGEQGPLGVSHVVFWVVVGSGLVFWVGRRGVRPSPGYVVAAAVLFAVWMVTGFHVNQHTGADFNLLAEVLNEGSKTLLAVAYLVPLMSRELLPGTDHQGRAGDAAAADLRA